VDVAHLEARPLAVQAARTESREAALVCELAERVRLVDDLAQLTAPEEEIDRRREGLGVDQVARRDTFADVVGLSSAHALLSGAAQLEEALAELLAGQLENRADAAIAQMVDIVELALTGAQLQSAKRWSGSLFLRLTVLIESA
jgi:hypothetical protein